MHPVPAARTPAAPAPWYWAFVAGVVAMGAGVLITIGTPPLASLLKTFILTLLVVAAGIYSLTYQAPKGSVSISLALYVGAIMVFSPAVSTWAAAIGTFIIHLGPSRQFSVALFAGGRAAVSVGLAALFYHTVAAPAPEIMLSLHWWPALFAGLIRVAISESLQAMHTRLYSGISPVTPWTDRQAAVSLGTSFALMASMGFLGALVFQQEPAAVFLLGFPLLALHLHLVETVALADANRQLAAQSHNLEHLVAERTKEHLRAMAQLRRRLEESATLQATAAALVRELDLTRLLENIAQESAKVTGADASFVTLVDQTGSGQHIRAVFGAVMQPFLGTELRLDSTLAGRVLTERRVLIVNDAQHDPRLMPEVVQGTGMKAIAEAPIRMKGEALGVLGVLSLRPKLFDADDARLLLSLGNAAAIAIHNAKLYEKAREVAVFEERTRLARELHDSVTQSLFSIVLNSEAARHVVVKDPERARDLLGRLSAIGQEALAEMRSLIFELRPQALQEKGLDFALQNHVTLFQRRHPIRVSLAVEPGVQLPAAVETAFYRVVQESLTNVGKHADATQVSVRVAVQDDQATLTITDDGQGFDPGRVGEDGQVTFGLTGMQERIADLGGQLSVRSAPGRGTEVRALVPLGNLNGGAGD